mgnify:CR=1 FL=1
MHKKIIQWQNVVTQILSAIVLVWTTKKRRKSTPILMAGTANQFSLRHSVPAYAMAALPLISPVPIQEVQLLDYAVAHKSVNSSYGLTANASDTYVIGKDPYTSDEQRVRDQYEINDTDWHEVSFKEVNGLSSCKLALHQDWIESHDYMVDGIVNMNLPEQGISGPFKITSIRHIQPQKIPVDEDSDDDYEYRPVTGLFTHQSDDVFSIGFTNATSLGVTATHPIYSTTYHDWRLAGELEVGERVLTYKGEATVSSTEKRAGSETVYNLEVKDLHNFLVGDEGVVVHNSCWDEAAKVANGTIPKADIWAMRTFPDIFKRGGIIEKIMRKSKYSSSQGWKYTGVGDGGLGKDNFWLVDFFKGNRVVSLKSTTIKNGSEWATSNADHIRDLNQQLKLKKFPNCKPGPNCINPSNIIENINEAELHIVVEKLSDIDKAEWITAIKSKLPANDQNNLIITITEL